MLIKNNDITLYIIITKLIILHSVLIRSINMIIMLYRNRLYLFNVVKRIGYSIVLLY